LGEEVAQLIGEVELAAAAAAEAEVLFDGLPVGLLDDAVQVLP